MSLNYTSDLMPFFATNIATDANYQSPGNFGLAAGVSGSEPIDHATIGVAGDYTAIPTATPDSGTATFQTTMKILSTSLVAAAGSGYSVADVLTIVGGTHSGGAASLNVAHLQLATGTYTTTAKGTGRAPGDVLTLSAANVVAATVTVGNTTLVSAGVSAAGLGYAPAMVLALSAVGGTVVTPAELTVVHTSLRSAAVNAPGSGFAPAMVVTLLATGGTTVTPATVTVVNTQLVNVAANAVGTGYSPGDVITLTSVGGTTVTPAEVTVDSVGGGGAIASFHISNAGEFSANPTSFTQASAAPPGGTGATFQTPLYGVKTFSFSNNGEFSANPTSFAQTGASSPGGGTGLTLDTPSYGVSTFTVSNGGEFSANSTSFTQNGASSPPGGTGATFNAPSYGALTVSMTTGGEYSTKPSNPVGTTVGGVQFNALWGVKTFTVNTASSYTTLPSATATTTVAPSGGTGCTITGHWGVNSLVVTDAGSYEIAPLINFSSGIATATAVLTTASTMDVDEQKLLLLIEIVRCFVDEATNTIQLKDLHMVLRKALAGLHFGSSAFDSSVQAERFLNGAMNYVAKNPTHSGANI